MTNKTRKIIFFICLLLFVIIAPLTIFYSQGYRIDFDNKAIKQTGGLFLKVVPRRADIYLNDSLIKRTDFFFGSALVENLLPKEYRVEIKKPGYHSWQKNLIIKEKEVTESKNIILFPGDIKFSLFSDQVEDFWLSPDEKKIILLEQEKPLISSAWSLKIYELDKKIKSHLLDETDISPQGAKLIDLDFSSDAKELYFTAEIKQEIRYFILSLDSIEPLLLEKEFLTENIAPITAFKQINSDLYYIDKDGYFFKSTLPAGLVVEPIIFPLEKDLLQNKEALSNKAFPLKEEKNYALEIFGGFIFLQEEKNLYQFNFDSENFEIIFDNIKNIQISPDKAKIIYFSPHEIWLLFLRDKSEPPAKRKGDKILLARLSANISHVNWINNHYLIFLSGNEIKISEIDDRDRINLVSLFEIKEFPPNGNSIKMIFDRLNRQIYLLNQENLKVSDPLFL